MASEGVKQGPGSARRVMTSVMKRANRRLDYSLGGPLRVRVIVVLACVLALSSADSATVGASAIALRHSLKIDNTDIGLLVAVSAGVAAVFSLPFGILADRVQRTPMLAIAIVTWGAAMVWSATTSSFGRLLVARLALGAVTAAAGPIVASLVGDWFNGHERGQIYSYILTGELLGAGIGFVVTGDISSISWRAAFLILALPAFVLAWFVWRLPEPERGTAGELSPDPGTRPALNADPEEEKKAEAAPGKTDAQQLALDRGIQPDEHLLEMANPKMRIIAAIRYVLAVRTNVALIVSGACAYFFLAGVQTFAPEFVSMQYRTSQVVANLLLLVLGVGAVGGILIGGPLGDLLLHRGRISGRVLVAAVAACMSAVLFIPALLTRSALGALPYLVIGAGALTAQNPPIDAARLDIMPSWLWGRSEGIQTFLRSGGQSLAPLLFGTLSDEVFGGGRTGLQYTFLVMLVPLAASAGVLFWAAKRYPTDVATAGLVTGPADAPGPAADGPETDGPETDGPEPDSSGTSALNTSGPAPEALEPGGSGTTGPQPEGLDATGPAITGPVANLEANDRGKTASGTTGTTATTAAEPAPKKH
ncbi:MAG TPA: MFS transporter [Acidimicrobiales bacterium]|nr:MFS transporter [Acidimicrobiales bacterium]